MKWCRYEVAQEVSYGRIDEDRVTEVSGSPFESYTVTATSHPLSSVKLLVPVVPSNFYSAGANYPEHITWSAEALGSRAEFPRRPWVGNRGVSSLVPHQADIIIPKDSSGELHYEGELVVVIGKKAKKISEERALSFVFGFTIGNDVSERRWQREDRTPWRAKDSDTFSPMGPWIVTDLDPANREITIRLNGRVVSQYNTRAMLFDVAAHICEITRYATLFPGDVLWMSTEGATQSMAPRDVVEIEIDGIGTLRNHVVAEE